MEDFSEQKFKEEFDEIELSMQSMDCIEVITEDDIIKDTDPIGSIIDNLFDNFLIKISLTFDIKFEDLKDLLSSIPFLIKTKKIKHSKIPHKPCSSIKYDPKIDNLDQFPQENLHLSEEEKRNIQMDIEETKLLKLANIPSLGAIHLSVWISDILISIRRSDLESSKRGVVELLNWGGKSLELLMEVLCKIVPIEDVGVADKDLIKSAVVLFQSYTRKLGNGDLNPSLKSKKFLSFTKDVLDYLDKLISAKKSRLIPNIAFFISKTKLNRIKKSSTPMKDFDKLFTKFKEFVEQLIEILSKADEDDFKEWRSGDGPIFKLYIDIISIIVRIHLVKCSFHSGYKIEVREELQSLFSKRKKKIYMLWKYLFHKCETLSRKTYDHIKYVLKLFNIKTLNTEFRGFSICSKAFGMNQFVFDANYTILAFTSLVFDFMGPRKTITVARFDELKHLNPEVDDIKKRMSASEESDLIINIKEILDSDYEIRGVSFNKTTLKQIPELKGEERVNIWNYIRFSTKLSNMTTNENLSMIDNIFYEKCLKIT